MITTKTRIRILLAIMVGLSSVVGLAQPAGAADGGPTVEVAGHGWGHGRGLGQYGAYGYARDHGWSSAQILDHYYGGTTSGSIPGGASIDPAAVRIELREERDMALVVGLGSGIIGVHTLEGAPLGTIDQGYAKLTRVEGGFLLEGGSSCRGPWEHVGPLNDQGGNDPIVYPASTVRVVSQNPSNAASGLLHLCEEGGVTWYGGEIRAVYSGGRQRAVNVVSLETYLKGVVPREIPASWTMAALEAQAVSARSYVMAGDSRQQPYADTCNTTLCQVYDGLFQGATPQGPSAVSRVRTDVAINATSGTVRRFGSSIARTEFSSSTGGHTAGGTFPSVEDAGDSVSANPNHDWSTTADLSSLEASYSLGRLIDIEVTARNGLGADGGRVKTVKITFDDGAVYRTGNSIRRALGLKSDWYSFGDVSRPQNEEDVRFINASYQTFFDRQPDGDERSHWSTQLEVGDRAVLTEALVNSGTWAGSEVDDLYQRALGRPADPDGRAYWVDLLGGNTKLEMVGVHFYGSQEYFNLSGGTNEGFVENLYVNILGRPSDHGGHQYWVSILRDDRGGYDDVAANFYYSVESRRTRARGLFDRILDRESGASETEYWADRLLTIDDLDLAVMLGSSDEFYDSAQR